MMPTLVKVLRPLPGLIFLALILGFLPHAFAETDVTAKVELIQSRLQFDRSTNTSYLDVAVKISSDDVLLSPIKVVIDSVTPADVTVANADGTTAEGKPYFEYATSTGQLLAGTSTATKRISFQNPKRLRFTYATHVVAKSGPEIINGIKVPPAPDVTVNQATLAGIDSNSNGLRDDVERILAQEFGTNPTLYEEARVFATTLQSAITTPGPETVKAHLDTFRCIGDNEKLSDIDKATTATIDTQERRTAYAQTFAGALISMEGCE